MCFTTCRFIVFVITSSQHTSHKLLDVRQPHRAFKPGGAFPGPIATVRIEPIHTTLLLAARQSPSPMPDVVPVRFGKVTGMEEDVE